MQVPRLTLFRFIWFGSGVLLVVGILLGWGTKNPQLETLTSNLLLLWLVITLAIYFLPKVRADRWML